MKTHRIKSNYGTWNVRLSEGALRSLAFPRRAPGKTRFRLHGGVPKDLAPVARFLRRYFAARIRRPAMPPPCIGGTPFQRRVWRQIARIPFGKTLSYRAVARKLEQPGAARAVGNACGANPLPLLIPCHRVVAEDGGLGGFSGNLAWKKWLLNFETATGKNSVSHVQQHQNRRRLRRAARPA
jgi:methylated-DNA-[protein]-cysteine S-methyltransferase